MPGVRLYFDTDVFSCLSNYFALSELIFKNKGEDKIKLYLMVGDYKK
jgi:hypothetical protein